MFFPCDYLHIIYNDLLSENWANQMAYMQKTADCSLLHVCNLIGCTGANQRGAVDTLWWCHDEHDDISNHQPHDCLLNRLFRRRSKKTSKLCVAGLCEGNSPVTSEFPAQRASNAENVSIWWCHNEVSIEWRYMIVMTSPITGY